MNKRRLYENIMRTVSKTIKRTLNETGHLYDYDDDDTPYTNPQHKFHGVPGTVLISHGEWSDPELQYAGKDMNATEIEDTLWSMYKEECLENDEVPTEEEFDNMPTEWFKNKLDEIMFGLFGDNALNTDREVDTDMGRFYIEKHNNELYAISVSDNDFYFELPDDMEFASDTEIQKYLNNLAEYDYEH